MRWKTKMCLYLLNVTPSYDQEEQLQWMMTAEYILQYLYKNTPAFSAQNHNWEQNPSPPYRTE